MNVQARRQREHAAGVMLAQAAQLYSESYAVALTGAEMLRLRGRALQLRGSAWVIQAEVMEAKA